MRIGILYMHEGPTGKIYIGETWQPKGERFNGNWWASGEGNPMFGRKHTKRTLKQMTAARRAENLPEEQRVAMREANKLRPRDAHGHYIKQGVEYHPNSLKRWGIKTP
jgi:hypothetical protein